MGIQSERYEWEAAGHVPWCFDTKRVCFSCDTGLSDGHTCTTKLDAMVQVNFIKSQPPSLEAVIQVSPSHHTSSSQTRPLPLLVDTEAQAQLTDSAFPITTASTLKLPALIGLDATTIPIIPIIPKNQPYQDLSALCPSHHFSYVKSHHSSLSDILFLVNGSFQSQTPLHHHYHQPH